MPLFVLAPTVLRHWLTCSSVITMPLAPISRTRLFSFFFFPFNISVCELSCVCVCVCVYLCVYLC